MDLSLGLRRLAISLCVSGLFHAVVLASLPRGHGWRSESIDSVPLSSQFLEVRLDRRMRQDSAATADVSVVVDTLAVADVASSAQQPALGPSDAIGLPIVEQTGPPYPPLEPRYLPATVIDVPPRPMTEIDPAPILVGDERGVGQVVLVLLISADGKVDEVLVEASSVSALFTDAAVSAFRKASFSPGTKKGAPVATRLRIEVDFGYRRSPSDGAGQSLGDEKR